MMRGIGSNPLFFKEIAISSPTMDISDTDSRTVSPLQYESRCPIPGQARRHLLVSPPYPAKEEICLFSTPTKMKYSTALTSTS